jgi:hypothetical protein
VDTEYQHLVGEWSNTTPTRAELIRDIVALVANMADERNDESRDEANEIAREHADEAIQNHEFGETHLGEDEVRDIVKSNSLDEDAVRSIVGITMAAGEYINDDMARIIAREEVAALLGQIGEGDSTHAMLRSIIRDEIAEFAGRHLHAEDADEPLRGWLEQIIHDFVAQLVHNEQRVQNLTAPLTLEESLRKMIRQEIGNESLADRSDLWLGDDEKRLREMIREEIADAAGVTSLGDEETDELTTVRQARHIARDEIRSWAQGGEQAMDKADENEWAALRDSTLNAWAETQPQVVEETPTAV